MTSSNNGFVAVVMFPVIVLFLAIGAAITYWGIGQLRLVAQSKTWPTVNGVVVSSGVTKFGRERHPEVIYTYSVDDDYESSQIGFAPFDHPGGRGKTDTILMRYRTGRTVVVYYHPNDPSISVLEPGDFSPFLMPMFFGVFFLLAGVFLCFKGYREFYPNQENEQAQRQNHIRLGTIIVSTLLYVVLILVMFDSGVQEVNQRAFRQTFGLSNLTFVILVQTILYIPVPWFSFHLLSIMDQARRDGNDIRLIGLFAYLSQIEKRHPHLRRSAIVSLIGFCYLAAVMVGWGVFIQRN